MTIKQAVLCALAAFTAMNASASASTAAVSEKATSPQISKAAAQAEVDKYAPELWASLKSTATALDNAIAEADNNKSISLTRERRTGLVSLRNRLKAASKKDTLSREDLKIIISDLENMQETIRQKGQMASTSFQKADQQANQMYNLLTSVIRTMNEMRTKTVRNML